MKAVTTKEAPAAIGPYSQAIVVGDMVYTSGQIALTADGSEDILKKGVTQQTQQVLKNLEAVLKAAGSDPSKVIKTTIFLANMDDFQKVNEVYDSFFKGHKPARSTVAAKSLPKGALVEIEAVALI